MTPADRTPEPTALIKIRAATADDWPHMWPLWHHIVEAGETYVWPPGTDRATARALWMLPPPAAQFVAEQADGTIVGTATLRPAQPGLGDHVANAAFMVHPDHAGAGIGRKLAQHVIDEAKRSGYQAMQFNAVVETNVGAVALWQSLGFIVLATVPAAFRHHTLGLVGLHIMYRRL